MSRGIVLETHKRYSVVLTPEGEYRRVPTRKRHAVGEEIDFESTVGGGARQAVNRTWTWSIAGAAAILLLLLLPRLLAFGPSPEVAMYVALDINPSIEIGIDRSGNVVELRALNDDGAHILAGVPAKGADIETVTAALIDNAGKQGYLTASNGEVLVTSMPVVRRLDVDFENAVVERIDQAVLAAATAAHGLSASLPKQEDQLAVTISHVKAPKEIRETSERQGVSPGKMAVYLLAEEKGLPITIEELKTGSVRQATAKVGGIASIIDEKQVEQKRRELEKLLERERKASGQDKGRQADAAANKDKEKEKDKKKDKEKERDKEKEKEKASLTKAQSNQAAKDKARENEKAKQKEKERDRQERNDAGKEIEKVSKQEKDREQDKQKEERKEQDQARDERKGQGTNKAKTDPPVNEGKKGEAKRPGKSGANKDKEKDNEKAKDRDKGQQAKDGKNESGIDNGKREDKDSEGRRGQSDNRKDGGQIRGNQAPEGRHDDVKGDNREKGRESNPRTNQAKDRQP